MANTLRRVLHVLSFAYLLSFYADMALFAGGYRLQGVPEFPQMVVLTLYAFMFIIFGANNYFAYREKGVDRPEMRDAKWPS